MSQHGSAQPALNPTHLFPTTPRHSTTTTSILIAYRPTTNTFMAVPHLMKLLLSPTNWWFQKRVPGFDLYCLRPLSRSPLTIMRFISTHISRTATLVEDNVITKIWAQATSSWDAARWKKRIGRSNESSSITRARHRLSGSQR